MYRSRISAGGATRAAPLLACYDPGGRLIYVGRADTGINPAELPRLWRLPRVRPTKIPSTYRRGAAAISDCRSGSARVHWVRPELVAEICVYLHQRNGVG